MPTKSLLNLSDALKLFVEQKRKNLSTAVSTEVINMVEQLANDTPVDTSKALSNWFVTINRFPTQDLPAHVEGFQGSTANQSISETVTQARLVLANKKVGDTVYVTNNVDYMEFLNDGGSGQHPGGFFEDAVAAAISRLFKARI